MEEAENQNCNPGVWLRAKETAEAVHVLEGLVDDREADHRVDEVRIGVNPAEHAEQQRRAVPERKEADVLHDVLQPVEEEDHADQEQQVVISGHHVLGTEIHQRNNRSTLQPLQVYGVLARYAMRFEDGTREGQYKRDAQEHSFH